MDFSWVPDFWDDFFSTPKSLSALPTLWGFRPSVAKRLRYAPDARTPHCGARTSVAPLGAVWVAPGRCFASRIEEEGGRKRAKTAPSGAADVRA